MYYIRRSVSRPLWIVILTAYKSADNSKGYCTILRGRFKGAGSRSIPQRQLPMLYLPIRADRTYVLSAIEHRKLN